MASGRDPHELLYALYTTYQVSPVFEDFDVADKANIHQVTCELWNRVLAQKPKGDWEIGFLPDYRAKPCTALIEPIGVNELLTFPLKALVTNRTINPTLREALLSIVHHMLTDNGIADWRVAIDHAEMTLSDRQDEDEDESEHIQLLEANLELYCKGEPAQWLRRIINMKPWTLDKLRAYKPKSKHARDILSAALSVIDHPLSFNDYVVMDHYDSGLYPDSYVYIAWDYEEPIESHYLDYVGCHVDNGDLSTPVAIYPLHTRKDWKAQPHGDTFFRPLAQYFDHMLTFLK